MSLPFSVAWTGAALAMFSSTISAIAAAAATSSRPSGVPIPAAMAAAAAFRSRARVPPANRAGSILPTTRSASVTVGSVPPCRSRPVLARADAVRTDPNAAQAVDARDRAPPAPISTRSTTGILTEGRFPWRSDRSGRLRTRLEFRHAVVDQADLGGRAAHVEGEQPADAEPSADRGGQQGAAGRSAFDQAHRERQAVSTDVGRPPTSSPAWAQRCPFARCGLQALEVAGHQRLDVGAGTTVAPRSYSPAMGRISLDSDTARPGRARRRCSPTRRSCVSLR